MENFMKFKRGQYQSSVKSKNDPQTDESYIPTFKDYSFPKLQSKTERNAKGHEGKG